MRLDAERALVQTVDFFTPVVDDPATYGAIAAANSLSDVYAMGGEPLTAMNVVGFPVHILPEDVLREVLRGAALKVAEAGVLLVGGHSVKAPEMFFGLSVTGVVHPDRIWRNAGARPGDALVLSKALGTGVLTTARKRDRIDEVALAPAVASMLRLNRTAAACARAFSVSAATDITGNGLAGHATEMARTTGVRLVFDCARLPWLPGAREAAEGGCVPGGTGNNAHFVGDSFDGAGVDDAIRSLLLDPQTSGGLLVAVPAEEGEALAAAWRAAGDVGVVVGHVEAGPAGVVFR